MWGRRFTEEDLKALVAKRTVRRVVGSPGIQQKPRTPREHCGKKGRLASAGEAMLLDLIAVEKLPSPEREYKFALPRQWRLDFAYPQRKVAIEVESMVHRIKGRYKRDIKKYNELALRGWTLVRVTAEMIRNGEARELLKRALE